MKIQLAPWEITATSLKVDGGKRRKSRESGASNGTLTSSAPIAACLVHCNQASSSMKRKSKKAKHHQESISSFQSQTDGLQPTLVVTSSHQIAVLGNKRSSLVDESPLHECADLQYNSRPDKASAFLPEETSSLSNLTPAVMDYQHERMYALQANGYRLAAWNVFTGGPDVDSVSVKLKSPAISLSFVALRAGPSLVYGSCVDGSVFLARLTSNAKGSESWLLEYLAPYTMTNERRSHVHTTIKVDSGLSSETKNSGTKRRATSPPDNGSLPLASLSIYQVYYGDADLTIIRRDLVLSIAEWMKMEKLINADVERRVETVSVALASCHVQSLATISNVCRVGEVACSGALYVDIAYTVKGIDDDSEERRFFRSIALESGHAHSFPFEIPTYASHLASIGQKYVTILSAGELSLFDKKRGARLLKAAFDMGPTSVFVVDETNERVSIVFAKDGRIHVATSSLIYMTAAQRNNCFTLAESLAESQTCSRNSQINTPLPSYELGLLSKGPCLRTEKALETVRQLLLSTLSERSPGSDVTLGESTLQIAFDKALESFSRVDAVEEPLLRKAGQDSVPELNGVTCNGKASLTNGQKPARVNGQSAMVNGLSPARKIHSTTRSLPAPFVWAVSEFCIDTLLAGKEKHPANVLQDACIILRRLIKSRSFSVRNNLPPRVFLRLLHAVDNNKSATFSTQQLMLDLLRNSKDVSEYHMIAMLRYLMRYGLTPGVDGQKSDSNGSIGKRFDQMLDFITSYSVFNSALLRAAAKEMLSQIELNILMKQLLTYLTGRYRTKHLTQNSRTRALFWLGALFELDNGRKVEKENVVAVRAFLSDEVKRIEMMLGLKQRVYTVAEALDAAASRDECRARTVAPNQQHPYQVERLVF